eukprot:SAG11_NODE_1207_length_5524_cov_2.959447_5_plen_89_part_00
MRTGISPFNSCTIERSFMTVSLKPVTPVCGALRSASSRYDCVQREPAPVLLSDAAHSPKGPTFASGMRLGEPTWASVYSSWMAFIRPL